MATFAERIAAAIARRDQRIREDAYARMANAVNAAFDAFDAEIDAEHEDEREHEDGEGE